MRSEIKYNEGLKPGWLKEQMDLVKKEVEAWPEWMKREADRYAELKKQYPDYYG
jgi:hypothetical protein